MLQRFWDADIGAFFDTARDHEALIGRPREITDNATPSGMSMAVEALLRLWALSGGERYYDVASRVLTTLAPAALAQPSAFSNLLCALDDYIGPFSEVAIVGEEDDERTQRLWRGGVLGATCHARSSPQDPAPRLHQATHRCSRDVVPSPARPLRMCAGASSASGP